MCSHRRATRSVAASRAETTSSWQSGCSWRRERWPAWRRRATLLPNCGRGGPSRHFRADRTPLGPSEQSARPGVDLTRRLLLANARAASPATLSTTRVSGDGLQHRLLGGPVGARHRPVQWLRARRLLIGQPRLAQSVIRVLRDILTRLARLSARPSANSHSSADFVREESSAKQGGCCKSAGQHACGGWPARRLRGNDVSKAGTLVWILARAERSAASPNRPCLVRDRWGCRGLRPRRVDYIAATRPPRPALR